MDGAPRRGIGHFFGAGEAFSGAVEAGFAAGLGLSAIRSTPSSTAENSLGKASYRALWNKNSHDILHF